VGKYEQAILLPNSLKSALVPFFAGIPKRTGWRGEMRFGLLNDMRKLDKQRYPLMIERFMALAYEPGAELPAPILSRRCASLSRAAMRRLRVSSFHWIARYWRFAPERSSASPSVGRPSISPRLPR
jgi:lipopolysaccharide heptosyltransferase II